MKRFCCFGLFLLLLAGLVSPALAALEFGPWTKEAEGRWYREVRDGDATGKQYGSGPDAEHINALYFGIEHRDSGGKLLYTNGFLPDGTPYYRNSMTEDGWRKTESFDPEGKVKEPLIKAYAASAEPFPFPFCQRFEVSGSKSDK